MKTQNSPQGKKQFVLLGAMTLLMSASVLNAQNSSYDADAIPVPGFGNTNAVFGSGSMLSNASGSHNSALGFFVLSSNTSGHANTVCGYGGLNVNNTGGFNSSYGVKAMYNNTSGYGNNGYGGYSLGQNITGNFNSGLGYQADVAGSSFDEATAIGSNAIVNNSYRVWLGSSVCDVWTTNSFNISDGRFKRNVTTNDVKGLDFIKRLRPVTYNFDAKALTEHLTQGMDAEKKANYLKEDFDRVYKVSQTGFIAQEVEEAAKASGYNFSGVHKPENKFDTYGVSYYQFVVPLVKAVQEQQQMIDEQKVLNEKLMQQVAEQQNAIDALLNANASARKALQNNSATGFSMDQNEPNPFTLETTVKYNLPKEINTAYMAVYDLSGKQVTTLPISQKGEASMVITSEKLASGIYIYSIIADGKVLDTKRMVVTGK